jgi:septum formation protein
MLLLASQSPRRKELLERAGIPCSVRASGIPETPHSHESAVDYVRRLAQAKANAVSRKAGETVLGADTVVVLKPHILEKPLNEDDARRMLELLSGRPHQVITGICIRHEGGEVIDHATTSVWFATLSPKEIECYVESGEPMDKAGAYAIQGLASRFIERVDGEYANVVGLPVALVYRHLRALGLI